MRPVGFEPDFLVLEYITITQDVRTGLVVAIGGTEQAAGILQTAGGFLNAPGPRGEFHRLPRGLPIEQQRLKATAAAHTLLAAGYSVHLDPALNVHASPDGDRQATQRYLAQLADRAAHAASDDETAEVLTEIAAPAQGLLPLVSDIVIRAAAEWSERLSSTGHDTEPARQLLKATSRLNATAQQITLARNEAAHASARPPHLPPAASPVNPARPGKALGR
ncbi:hypothetical protein [Streptomyces sp. NPDC048385]|uniref:hypothetical protein n=1 Tax=Streptomyces sp. NPDC048385 TaxID=3155145 RepID=UPI0034335857